MNEELARFIALRLLEDMALDFEDLVERDNTVEAMTNSIRTMVDTTPDVPDRVSGHTPTANANEAMVAIQAILEDAKKSKEADTGKYKYNFANIADFLPQLRELAAEHGCFIHFETERRGNDLGITASLVHSNGTDISSWVPFPSNSPRDPQESGSYQTYLRRYAVQGLFAMASVEDDEDAQGTRVPKTKAEVTARHKEVSQALSWYEGSSLAEKQQLITDYLDEHHPDAEKDYSLLPQARFDRFMGMVRSVRFREGCEQILGLGD